MKTAYTFLIGLLPAVQTLAAADEISLGSYKDATVTVYTTADLEECIDSKHNYQVILASDISVCPDNLNDWDDDHLFSLSNYHFSSDSNASYNLSFHAENAESAGKVFRNGKTEFNSLRDISFYSIHNTKSNSDGTTGSGFNPDYLTSYGYGGVMCGFEDNGGTLFQGNHGNILFRDICYNTSSFGDLSCSIGVYGGAIYAESSHEVIFRENKGDITFYRTGIKEDQSSYNYSYRNFHGYGGVIRAASTSFSNNTGSISFVDCYINQTAAEGDTGQGYGGALYLSGTTEFADNVGAVNFNGNFVHAVNTAQGGAICTGSNSTIRLTNNADIDFCNNSAAANETATGGAIHLNEGSNLIISDNRAVSFRQNNANMGGAIYAETGTTIEINNNSGDISFSGNTSTQQGSSIYTKGTLSIRNNGDVLFRDSGNTHAVYMITEAKTGDSPHLRLSAAADTSITFSSSLYADSNSSLPLQASLNEDFNADTPQTGSIIFDGNTSTLNADTTLYNGTLALRNGATLQGRVLTTEKGSISLSGGSSLLMNGISMGDGTSVFVTGSGNELSAIALGELASLDLTLSAENEYSPLLSISSLLVVNGPYILNINLPAPLSCGDYTLLQLSPDYAYASSAWNEENIRVTGALSFADLHWENDYTRLVYTVIPEPGIPTLVTLALCMMTVSHRRRS